MINDPQVRRLTVAQWIAVPDYPDAYPRARPTRVDNATHLHALNDRHKYVTMATLPDGSECKIDGHKRARVWCNRLSDKLPDIVIACVFNVASVEELRDVYSEFNRSAH